MSALKDAIAQAVDRLADELDALSRKIHDTPELGYAVILLPVDTLFVAVRAIQRFLSDVRTQDTVLPFADRYVPFREFNELIGVAEQITLGEKYSS